MPRNISTDCEKRRKQIADHADKTGDIYQTANDLGCCVEYVRQCCKAYGVQTPKRETAEIVTRVLYDLVYNLDLTQQEIADRHGIHRLTVGIWAKQARDLGFEVPTRRQGRPKK